MLETCSIAARAKFGARDPKIAVEDAPRESRDGFGTTTEMANCGPYEAVFDNQPLDTVRGTLNQILDIYCRATNAEFGSRDPEIAVSDAPRHKTILVRSRLAPLYGKITNLLKNIRRQELLSICIKLG
jgi:hypothetical protein